MIATQPTQSFLDDPVKRKRYEIALAEIRKEIQPILDELDECTRLTAEDYAVTINCRQ